MNRQIENFLIIYACVIIYALSTVIYRYLTNRKFKTKEYFYTPYIPNTGTLIPSNWHHYGQSPNMSTNNLRTTIAFSYMVPKVFEEYVERGNKTVIKFV